MTTPEDGNMGMKMVGVDDIKISIKYKGMIKRHSDEERKFLVKSIQERGIEKPLETGSASGCLVDGYERFEIGKSVGMTIFPVIEKKFDTELDEEKYVIENNLCRRNLSIWWIGKLNNMHLELEKQLADTGSRPSDIEPEEKRLPPPHEKKNPVPTIAKKKDISPRSQEQVKRIIKHDDKEMIKKLDKGEMSTQRADKMIRDQEIKTKPIPKLPEGKWNCIVENHSWIGTKSSKQRPVTPEEIAKMPVSDMAADNALLFLWTTNRHLLSGTISLSEYLKSMGGACEGVDQKETVQSDAMAVMRSHGFVPRTMITWRMKKGVKKWLEDASGHVIIGTRGSVTPFELDENTVIAVDGDGFDEVWELIEKCVNTQRWDYKKIQLGSGQRDGWSAHENKTED